MCPSSGAVLLLYVCVYIFFFFFQTEDVEFVFSPVVPLRDGGGGGGGCLGEY